MVPSTSYWDDYIKWDSLLQHTEQEIWWTQTSIKLLIWKKKLLWKVQVYKERKQYGILFQNLLWAGHHAKQQSIQIVTNMHLLLRVGVFRSACLFSNQLPQKSHIHSNTELKTYVSFVTLFLGLPIHTVIPCKDQHRSHSSACTYLPDKCQAQWPVLRQYRWIALNMTLA